MAARDGTARMSGSAAMDEPIDDATLDDVLAALANPVRRRILDRLIEGERPVSALAESFSVTRPAVSQHLRVLLDAGLVSEHRAGREHRYRLEPERLRAVRAWLDRYERFWRDRLAALGEYLDETDDRRPATPAPEKTREETR